MLWNPCPRGFLDLEMEEATAPAVALAAFHEARDADVEQEDNT